MAKNVEKDQINCSPSCISEHAVSNPISMMHRRPGSLPGTDPTSILSPRSSETGALGVNMAEYVLGGSPVGKEMDARLRMKPFVSSIRVIIYRTDKLT